MSGALPTINRRESQPVQDATVYEQRRLFYVAITRTIDTLVVSSFTRMQARDAYASGIDVLRTHMGIERTAPSPFIAELGRDAPMPINTEQWRQQAGF